MLNGNISTERNSKKESVSINSTEFHAKKFLVMMSHIQPSARY